MSTNAKTVSRYATKQIILVGLFGALSTILMLLEFSLPFIPPFVKMDFSELPVILGGYFIRTIIWCVYCNCKSCIELCFKWNNNIWDWRNSELNWKFKFHVTSGILL